MQVDHIKRFVERWAADKTFRDQLAQNPAQAVQKYGLQVDPMALAPIWRPELKELLENEDKTELHARYPYMKEYQEYLNSITLHDVMQRMQHIKHAGFKAWRSRQEARTQSQFPKHHDDKLIHLMAAYELSAGCSVGCWFCGLSAPKLEGVFRYTEENARLWQGVLEIMVEVLGPAAGASISYWATEPLDNPDYESFCLDQHRITGVFPQTTTARPMHNLERTRHLLKLSQEKGCGHNRFSLCSLDAFERVHQEFSPQELHSTLLKTYYQNSRNGISLSGRAWENRENPDYAGYELCEDLTIACVSGFLINLVHRDIQLITPCVPSQKWPLGYEILAKARFSDAASFRAQLEAVMRDHMQISFPPDALMRFRDDLSYQPLDDGFEVSTKFMTRRYRNHPYLRDLGGMIHKGEHTPQEAAAILEFYMVPGHRVTESIDLMFSQGILQEPSP